MANTDRLAEVAAQLAERDEEFRPIESASNAYDESSGEKYWALSKLSKVLGLEKPNRIKNAINRAKVSASANNMSIADNFTEGDLFDDEGETYLTKYAASLFVMNCDPRDGTGVALGQHYFALKVNKQMLEDEKRIKTRLDVASETKRLNGQAQECGVDNFQKFNGMGVQGLYGGRSVAEIKRMKGITDKAGHLDFACSEELASNLFRITQTRAALVRQGVRSETVACSTHYKVAKKVRDLIIDAGNTPPEELPPCEMKIDRLATAKKKQLKEASAVYKAQR